MIQRKRSIVGMKSFVQTTTRATQKCNWQLEGSRQPGPQLRLTAAGGKQQTESPHHNKDS